MDKQATFNKVVTALIAQGCRSSDGTRCLYRGPNGTKCAIGLLVDDEHIYMLKEGPGISGQLDGTHGAALRQLLDVADDSDEEFLGCLQDMHDGLYFDGTSGDKFTAALKENASWLAKRWHLNKESLNGQAEAV